MQDAPELRALIDDVSALVTLPDVYYRVEQALGVPNASLDAVGRVISSDVDLSARLLRIANSAFFGFPGRIEDIGRALTTLGTQQLRDLVLATTVIKQFDHVPVEAVSLRSFWEHAIACGAAARTIAIHRREPNVERFYVTGLLHDIGRLVLYLRVPELMSELLEEHAATGEVLYELERRSIGFDHAAVGGALMEAWRIPQSLFEPVQWHHAPGNAQRYPLEAAVVHVADVIVDGMNLGTSGERSVPPLDADAWRRIDIPESVLPEIMNRVEEHHQETVRLFLPENGG